MEFYLLNVTFLNIKDYVKGNLYMNSPEEKKLFDL